jgi:transglutaminase-like putative cysteine protease
MSAGTGTSPLASALATPVAAGIATACAATGMASVINGFRWLPYVGVTIAVVVAVGVFLRAVRVATPLVALAQLAGLLCLAVTLFTRSGILVVIPGPAAITDLGRVLGRSFEIVQEHAGSVPAEPPVLCLVTLAIGVAAVLVDTLAVAAEAPAASGLVLLCIFAVPTVLAAEIQPWWSFTAGVIGFALLLAIDGANRHLRWRGRLGLAAGGGGGSAPSVAVVTGVAVLVALLVGASMTMIGTQGRLPGAEDQAAPASNELGLAPFARLRGMLERQNNPELFQVRGLGSNRAYLRALTLRTYQPNEGWVSERVMAPGVAADHPLPPGLTEPGGGQVTPVQITPTGWTDLWLPVVGKPRKLDGVSDEYRYDNDTGVVYSTSPRHPGPYVVQTVLTEPSTVQLRSAVATVPDLNPAYTQLGPVDPRVVALARQITQGAPTTLDKAVAVSQYFRNPANGFTYSLQTAPSAGRDPLGEFLFDGKRGYCEQYAAAMAVMMRTLGIPSRVAIGFMSNAQAGDRRIITAQDAHAWVEVFFPGYGWQGFEPTAFADGRGTQPDYVPAPARPTVTAVPTTLPGETTAAPAPDAAASGNPDSQQDKGIPLYRVLLFVAGCVLGLLALAQLLIGSRGARRRKTGQASGIVAAQEVYGRAVGIGLAVAAAAILASLVSWWLGVVIILLGFCALPAGIRDIQGNRRAAAVRGLGQSAADAAWSELLSASWDRGLAVPDTDTVRGAARRLAREHAIDATGRASLRTMVGAVEQSWYGTGKPDAELPEAFNGVLTSLRRNAPLPLRARVLPRSVFQPPSRQK